MVRPVVSNGNEGVGMDVTQLICNEIVTMPTIIANIGCDAQRTLSCVGWLGWILHHIMYRVMY